MAMRMRIETPIAFGLTLSVFFALCVYCWRIRKIRHRLTGSVQVSALPIADSTISAEEHAGIKQEVIATFPTVKAHELQDDTREGCPICLVEYSDAEVLRQLPRCGHVFHQRCVDSWLEHQVTCPVCRIVLTDDKLPNAPTESRYRRSALQVTPAPSVTTSAEVPAWVLVNRPMPLPPRTPTAIDPSPSLEPHINIDVSNTPLLERHSHPVGWGAVYLENHSHRVSFTTMGSDSQAVTHTGIHETGVETGIQTKECILHESSSERWTTESFVFGISGISDDESSCQHHASHASRSLQPVASASCDMKQTLKLRLPKWELENDVVVLESTRVTPFLPLTMSPERCSFEFLPILSAEGGAASRSPARFLSTPSRFTFYSER